MRDGTGPGISKTDMLWVIGTMIVGLGGWVTFIVWLFA